MVMVINTKLSEMTLKTSFHSYLKSEYIGHFLSTVQYFRRLFPNIFDIIL